MTDQVQLKKDAERYRFLRNGDDGELWNDLKLKPADWDVLCDEFGESFDQVVDELMIKNQR
jgi:hypothetical protein